MLPPAKLIITTCMTLWAVWVQALLILRRLQGSCKKLLHVPELSSLMCWICRTTHSPLRMLMIDPLSRLGISIFISNPVAAAAAAV
jgi:hypothetical protein